LRLKDVRTTLTVEDRVHVLANGKVVFRGTPQELDAREDFKKNHMGV
jgi:ABC-type lipopolysaccharide export system ATPase subunit